MAHHPNQATQGQLTDMSSRFDLFLNSGFSSYHSGVCMGCSQWRADPGKTSEGDDLDGTPCTVMTVSTTVPFPIETGLRQRSDPGF
jgi:hypothetical protein